MKYQVGGSLPSNDPTYVSRQADEQLYTSLKAGDFCYVLNARQMGKSSLLHRTSNHLKQEGHSCIYLDVTRLGSEETTTEHRLGFNTFRLRSVETFHGTSLQGFSGHEFA